MKLFFKILLIFDDLFLQKLTSILFIVDGNGEMCADAHLRFIFAGTFVGGFPVVNFLLLLDDVLFTGDGFLQSIFIHISADNFIVSQPVHFVFYFAFADGCFADGCLLFNVGIGVLQLDMAFWQFVSVN